MSDRPRTYTTLSTEPRYAPTPIVSKGTLTDAVQDRLFLHLMKSMSQTDEQVRSVEIDLHAEYVDRPRQERGTR